MCLPHSVAVFSTLLQSLLLCQCQYTEESFSRSNWDKPPDNSHIITQKGGEKTDDDNDRGGAYTLHYGEDMSIF